MAAGARFWPRSATPSGSLAAVLHAAPGRDLMVFSNAFVCCCFWGRTKYVGGRTEWWQRLRVDWDVACYDRGFGDNSKGLPGPPGPPGLPSGGERVKARLDCSNAGPFPIVKYSADANEWQMAGMRCQLLWWLVYSAFTSCSIDAVRRRVRQSKVRENVWKEGRCRMQDRDGLPQREDMRREDQAVGVSHARHLQQPLDGGLPLVGRGEEQGRKLAEGPKRWDQRMRREQ